MPAKVKCTICDTRYTPRRSDSRYCSDACRQRAFRLRSGDEEALLQEIADLRIRYWAAVARLEAVRGGEPPDLAPMVLADGSVIMDGKVVGHVEPPRPGWAVWGYEAAGPPFSPPPCP